MSRTSPATFSDPRFPFTGWSPQVVDERLGYIWFAEPNVFVNQAHVTRADVPAAKAVHEWIDRALEARRQSIAAAGGLVILHDWRCIDGYESEARRVFLDRMRTRAPGYLKAAHAFVPDSPFFRMAIQAANLVAALRGGGRVEVGLDPAPVVQRLGLVPPPPGQAFPAPVRWA